MDGTVTSTTIADLRVIATKHCSILPKFPEMKPYHSMQFSVILGHYF